MSDGIKIIPYYEGVTRRLERLSAQIAGDMPLLNELGIEGVRQIVLNFKAGGRDTKWRTSARARKQGGQTLKDTGNLRSSVSYQIQGRSVVVGSNVKYGRIHHFGGTIKHPGGTPYIRIGPNPMDIRFLRLSSSFTPGKKTKQQKGIRKINKALKSGAEVKYTKPHDIKIPARPWLVWSEKAKKRFKSILKSKIEKK